MARQYYKDSTTGQMKPIGVKVEDTLPVGTIVEYNGQNIPEGWVDIGNGKIEKQYQVIPTNAKLENGDSTSETNGYTADYINDHSVVVSAVEPTGSARKKVWKKHSSNLFDKSIWTRGYINATGEVVSANTQMLSASIPVKPNTSYTVSTNANVVLFAISEFNATNTFIQREGSSSGIKTYTITTTANTQNIRFVINYDNSTTITQTIIDNLEVMMNEGSTALPYEPYAQDKEYILNDNVYEEFINNEPVVLYNNPTGTTENITLSDSVANYNYIEIYFMDNSGYSRFERYYNVNGKTVDLGILRLNNITNKQLKLTSKNVTISGTSITNGDAIVSYIKLDATVTGDSYTTNELSITRVLGYK